VNARKVPLGIRHPLTGRPPRIGRSGFRLGWDDAGVAQRQCERFLSERSWVRLLPPAPRPCSSIGRASGLYLERCAFETTPRAPIHAAIAQWQSRPLVRERSSVRFALVAPSCARGGTGRRTALRMRRARPVGVRLPPRAPIAPVAELADARCSKQRTVQVRVLPGVPKDMLIYARVAQRQSVPFTPGRPGFRHPPRAPFTRP
jgi:hypothetical protein